MRRIDPRLPILWRDPHTIQIGFAHALVRLDHVTPNEERLISGLHAGMSEVTLRATAAQLGVRATECDALLEALAPALEGESVTPLTLGLAGRGLGTLWLGHTLRESGHRVIDHSWESENVATIIVSESMALSPATLGRHLRRDIPHLPVVWLDTAVEVGPLVIPGQTPCWHCVETARCHQDPARRALLSQVMDRPAASECVPAVQEVATRVLRWIDGSDTPGLGTMLRLETGSGRWSSAQFSPHEECSCRTL